MRFAPHALLAAFALVFTAACSSSNEPSAETERQSAEEFCEEVVSASCSTLSTCCSGGTDFDTFECRRVSLANCFDALGVNYSYSASHLRFDHEAAATCLAPLTSCPSARDEIPSPSSEKAIACRNVLTGHAPLGAGCSVDLDCASVGPAAYASCYRPPTAGMGVSGVCAKAVTSTDNSCGFFADSLEYRLCPDDFTCVIPESALPAEDAEGKARFDLRGSCRAPAQVGQPCGPADAGGYVECAKGLICRHTGAAQSVCAQPKIKGQECTSSSECADGLECNPDTYLCDDPIDQPQAAGLYCYAPPQTQTPGPVCLGAGDHCGQGEPCCAGLTCDGGVCSPNQQCVDDGGFCVSNGDCCDAVCTNNVCGDANACSSLYEPCVGSSDCCGTLVCDSGMCL